MLGGRQLWNTAERMDGEVGRCQLRPNKKSITQSIAHSCSAARCSQVTHLIWTHSRVVCSIPPMPSLFPARSPTNEQTTNHPSPTSSTIPSVPSIALVLTILSPFVPAARPATDRILGTTDAPSRAAGVPVGWHQGIYPAGCAL